MILNVNWYNWTERCRREQSQSKGRERVKSRKEDERNLESWRGMLI